MSGRSNRSICACWSNASTTKSSTRALISLSFVAFTSTDCHRLAYCQVAFGLLFGHIRKIPVDKRGSLWQLLPQMNTNTHAAEIVVNPAYEKELRARCPKWMKDAVATVAQDRVLDEADILREALNEYLMARGLKKPQPQPEQVAA